MSERTDGMTGKRGTVRPAFSGHRATVAGWPTLSTEGARRRLYVETGWLLCDDGITKPWRPMVGKPNATAGLRAGPLPAKTPDRI